MLMLVSMALGAGPWVLDPAAPPARLGAVPELGPGAVRLQVRGETMVSTGSAVLSLRPGAAVPVELRRQGQPLGRTERTWSVPVATGEDALTTALRWKQHPAVKSASPNFWRPAQKMAFDDPDVGAQWYHEMLAFDVLSETSLGDPSVHVAVIDGGIDIAHADLAEGVIAPFDAIDDDDDPSPIPGEDCPPGDTTSLCDDHGTSTAGIITARANNGIDIVGLCSACSLIPIRLVGGGATLADDVEAFEHAIDNNAAVINNSWGWTTPIAVPQPLADVVQRAATETRGGLGALVVFAAGNDDRELLPNEITNLPEVLTVGATDRYGFRTAYSNYGDSLDIAAPSATVTLAAGGGLNTLYGGTSAAAPVASGIGAWALSVDPELSAAELKQLLIETADPAAEDGGHHPDFGWGNLDALRLHNQLLGIEDPEDDEEDGPTGCQTAPSAVGLFWLGLVGLFTRRRSATTA